MGDTASDTAAKPSSRSPSATAGDQADRPAAAVDRPAVTSLLADPDATPLGDADLDDAALEKQRVVLGRLGAVAADMAAFNSRSARLLPQLGAALTAHGRALSALRTSIVALDARAARCRARALALAERDGVDVSRLRLHDPDAPTSPQFGDGEGAAASRPRLLVGSTDDAAESPWSESGR